MTHVLLYLRQSRHVDDMRCEAGSVESGHSPDGIDNGPAKQHRQEVLWEAVVGPVGNK
jgi:hypothetical protein